MYIELWPGLSHEQWGWGSTTEGDPFNTYYDDCRAQSLILASDLNDVGISGATGINGIQLYCSEVPGRVLEGFRIRLQHTSSSVEPDEFLNVGWTDCFGPTDIAETSLSVDTWYSFSFSTNFEWNGTDNILIDISRDGTSYASGGGMYQKTVGASDRTRTYQCDSCTAYNTESQGGSHYLYPSVPSIKIGIEQTLVEIDAGTLQSSGSLLGIPWEAKVDSGPLGMQGSLFGNYFLASVDAGFFTVESDFSADPILYIGSNTFVQDSNINEPSLVFFVEIQNPATVSISTPSPSRKWSVLSSLVEQTIYTCTLYPPNGVALDPLDISMTSMQLRLRDGQPSYISFVATAEDGLIDAITARAGGTVGIESGVKLRDGSIVLEPLVSADYDSMRYELGGRSGSVTVTAYKTETTIVSKVVDVSGVSMEAMQATGKRRIRTEPSFFLRPGDVAAWNGNQMIVGMIALSVTPKTAIMDITER